MSAGKSGYKLYYYPGRGRGEICRLAFAAAKIEYEDIRLKGDDLIKLKASGKVPFNQMPFIETPEGKVLGQSGAVLKYICRQAGLCPVDSFDEAIADSIIDGTADLRDTIIKHYNLGKDPAKTKELMTEFFKTTLPPQLENYTAILKSQYEGNGFFCGDKLTYGDIALFDLFNSFLAKGEPTVPVQLNNYPLLVDHYNRVLNVPEIKAWIEKRPKSVM